MEKLIRRIGLVAHDAMKKDLIEWVLWNSDISFIVQVPPVR